MVHSAKSADERRAARRNATWGIARSHEELDDMDIEFWQNATAGERFAAVAEMAEMAATSLPEEDGAPLGIQGPTFGVRGRGR